jgi:putative hydrolase of HD superfamily
MAILLSEYVDEPVDLLRVLKMLLIHDIVEIDAGDAYCYDEAMVSGKSEREKLAAERLFSMLPEDQAGEFGELWSEFEARGTPEARFAAALDRLMPLLQSYYTRGESWREHAIRKEQVIARNVHIRDCSEALWRLAESLIDDAAAKKFLASPD